MHNLVFVKALITGGYALATECDPNAEALMCYRHRQAKDVPWHKYGKARDEWDWASFKEAMCLDEITIESSDSYSRVFGRNGEEKYVRVPGEQHLRLHLGDDSIHVGTLGQSYALLSRRDFYAPLEAFLAEGFSLDTAGELGGGSRSWYQVDTGYEAEVRKGDPVRTSILVANSYDGSLRFKAGRVTTRTVCENTIRVALEELENGVFKMSAKHSGNIQGRMRDITQSMQAYLAAAREEIELFRRLDAVKVRGQLDLLNYAGFLASNASEAKIRAGIDSIPKVSNRAANELENAWMVGPGSRRETYWDLYNASTFTLTHSLGNEKAGEGAASRAGRRLDSLMFGASGDKLTDALRIAETMASLRAA